MLPYSSAQAEHSVRPCASAKKPTEHGLQAAAPLRAATEPAGHGAQLVGPTEMVSLADSTTSAYLPGPQLVHCSDPASAANAPAGQLEQALEPFALAKVPAAAEAGRSRVVNMLWGGDGITWLERSRHHRYGVVVGGKRCHVQTHSNPALPHGEQLEPASE